MMKNSILQQFKMNRYRYYIIVQAFVTVAVIFNFKFIEPKTLASLVASFIFIFSSCAIVFYEYKNGWGVKSLAFWSTLIFFVFLILPIFIFRLMYWEVPFNEIEVMGLRPEWLHQISNQFFVIVLFTYFVDSFRVTRQRIK